MAAQGSPTRAPERLLILALDRREHGGIQRYVDALERAAIAQLGAANVRVVAVRDPERPARSRLARRLAFVRATFAQLRRLRPDVVVCTHVALLPVARPLSAAFRARLWVVTHGIEAWGGAPNRALRSAARVLAVSKFTADRVAARHGVDPSRLRLLPCPFDDRLLSVEPAAGATPIPRDRRVLLTVARLSAAERYKGHDVVLRAMPRIVRAVPQAAYLIVGDGDDRERLESLARSLGVAAHVTFAGRVDDAALAACYRSSAVFIMPARVVLADHEPKGEGFGIVYLEAMAFGLPVVGPAVGAPAEFLRDGEHGLLVDPESEDEVAAAAIKLLDSPADAARLGRAGLAAVDAFSQRRFAERLGALLRE